MKTVKLHFEKRLLSGVFQNIVLHTRLRIVVKFTIISVFKEGSKNEEFHE